MKTVVVNVTGALHPPDPALADRTPLQAARTHHAAGLANRGSAGFVDGPERALANPLQILALAAGLPAGTMKGWTLEAVEAAGIGWTPPADFALFRGAFLTLDDGKLRDTLVGTVSAPETELLAGVVEAALAAEGAECRATGQGRLVLAVPRALAGTAELPTLEAVMYEEARSRDLYRRVGDPLRGCLLRVNQALAAHAVNEVRVDLGENPVNGLWLSGRSSPLRPLTPTTGVRTGILASSSRGRGVARLCGAESHPLVGIWAADPRDAWRIRADTIERIRDWHHIVVEVELPDVRAGRERVRALDVLDQVVMGPLVAVLEAYRPLRILLVASPPENRGGREPGAAPLPVILAGDGIRSDDSARWDEDACAAGGLGSMKLDHLVAEMQAMGDQNGFNR